MIWESALVWMHYEPRPQHVLQFAQLCAAIVERYEEATHD